MKAPAIEQWWPVGQSLDLVEADLKAAAKAMQAEIRRFAGSDSLNESWVQISGLDLLFGSVNEFTNTPTVFFAIPTRSRWTVLWNNTFLCDGYDSLCACLTKNHGLTTLHWIAHDDTTTFQPGASFSYRRLQGNSVTMRSVHCGRSDSRWRFEEYGDQLPQEDIVAYSSRRKRDRLNESVLMSLLRRFDAQPWEEGFYDFSRPCYRLKRTTYPSTIIKRSPADVVTASQRPVKVARSRHSRR